MHIVDLKPFHVFNRSTGLWEIATEASSALKMFLCLKGNQVNDTSNETASSQLQQPKIFRPLARAAYELSVISFTGLAGESWPRNDSLALELLEKSAEAGDLQASLALAYRYHQGKQLPQNCDRAFRSEENLTYACFGVIPAGKIFLLPPEFVSLEACNLHRVLRPILGRLRLSDVDSSQELEVSALHLCCRSK